MKRMKTARQSRGFGVWATAFDQGESARLSSSWRQRLSRLGKSSHVTTRRACAAVAIVLLVTVASSLLHFSVQRPALAEDSTPIVAQAPPKIVEYQPAPTDQEKRIQEVLDEPQDFDLSTKSLNAMIEAIAADRGITILLAKDFDAPAAAAPKLHKVSLRSLLRLLDLPYMIDNDVLSIGDESFNSHLVTRIYPVADLVSPLRPASTSTYTTQPGPPPKYEELVELIQSSIGDDAWEPNGGQGRIAASTLTQSIVVTQSYMLQERVLDFLRALRAARAGNSPLQRASASAGAQVAPLTIRGAGINSQAGLVGVVSLDEAYPSDSAFKFHVGIQR